MQAVEGLECSRRGPSDAACQACQQDDESGLSQADRGPSRGRTNMAKVRPRHRSPACSASPCTCTDVPAVHMPDRIFAIKPSSSPCLYSKRLVTSCGGLSAGGMSDAEKDKPAEEPERAVKLEKALSDRSTCRATGEKIGKGEWRIGMSAWMAGRMSTVWQVKVLSAKDSTAAVASAPDLSRTFRRTLVTQPQMMTSSSTPKQFYCSVPAEASAFLGGLFCRILRRQRQYGHLQTDVAQVSQGIRQNWATSHDSAVLCSFSGVVLLREVSLSQSWPDLQLWCVCGLFAESP